MPSLPVENRFLEKEERKEKTLLRTTKLGEATFASGLAPVDALEAFVVMRAQ